MKKNLLKNVWLRVVMIAAVVTTAFAGTALAAADEVYKTALFGEGYNSGHITNRYGQAWTATNGDFMVTLTFFTNGSGNGRNAVTWNYVACGGSQSAYEAEITTASPIDKPITKVDLTILGIENVNNVNSIKLYSSADYANWREAGEFAKAAGTQTVAIPNPDANLFYKVVADVKGGTANNVKISRIDYYKAIPDPNAVVAPGISGEQEFTESTDVTITCETAGATILYSTDHGAHWTTYTDVITLTDPTTIYAKATKAGMTESEEVSMAFHLSSDEVNATWNLKNAPSTSSQTLVTWTAEYATMSLAKGGSTTAANSHVGSGRTNAYTQFSTNQILTIAPLAGYTIVSVTFTCNSNYASGLTDTWTNASVTSSNNTTVVVAPEDGTLPISKSISRNCRVTAVNVEYAPVSLPYIAAADVTATNLAANGTIEVTYNRVDRSTAALLLSDEEGKVATYDCITASLNSNKDITYTLTANETGADRVAYIHVYVPSGAETTIAVTQEGGLAVAIGVHGYTSIYYGDRNLVVPEGVTAYTYKVGTKLEVSKTYSPGEVIPAGTAVVLGGSQGSYSLSATTETGTPDENNMLRGSDKAETTTGGTYFYAFTTKNGANPGFYWRKENGAAYVNNPHKAYLALPKTFAQYAAGETEVKGYFALPDEDATAIKTIDNGQQTTEGAIYNVAGQRLQKMQKGINIVNGKKILF